MWFKKKIDNDLIIPSHIAIIMDGNGRWAQKRNLPRLAGHKAGVEALKQTIKNADALGVKYLTVYAFSTENWNRPSDEVTGLMELIVFFLKRDLNELIKQGVRIRTIGDITALPQEPLHEILSAVEVTKTNDNLQLIIALNYGGRQELIEMTKKIVNDCVDRKISVDDIDDQLISAYLHTKEIPDPDLVIRTSGEVRTSNFLLWQSSYSEYYFTDVLWPDFNHSQLLKAIESYTSRDRRFGKVK